LAFKEYMKKRHLSGHKSGLCDKDGNVAETPAKEKKEAKKMVKKEKKRAYLDV